MRKRENVPKGIFERRPEPVGYTYIMADIHGMYELYLAMLEKIRFSPEDVLYVLGDAIDRGRDGIRILQDFMKRAIRNRQKLSLILKAVLFFCLQ